MASIEIYWDVDCEGFEGWSYRVEWEHGRCESGALDDLGADADVDDMAAEVVEIGREHGLTVRIEDVEIDMLTDGGMATWNRS
jgi:hypothetical protein